MTLPANFNASYSSLWDQMRWEPSAQQIEQFIALQQLLNNFNSQLNLTKLVDGEDYWIGQVFDSLWPFQKELTTPHQLRNCIDVGTGCGFPGLAIAICLPGAKVTLVDSTRKKTTALKEIIRELDLSSRINILTERIEVTAHRNTYRGQFNFAMARAVANATVTAEYLIPLLKIDGEACLYRGKWNQEEEKSLLQALILLKGKISKIQELELPANRGIRHFIRLKSESPCPTKYPRPTGVPTKKPLGIRQ